MLTLILLSFSVRSCGLRVFFLLFNDLILVYASIKGSDCFSESLITIFDKYIDCI